MDEPLLLEKIGSDAFIILPDGDRAKLQGLSDEDFKYLTPRFYAAPVDTFKKYIHVGRFENFELPYMMFSDTFECPQMEIIRYDNDTIDLLNSLGLHIFLTENVLKYSGERVKLSRQNLTRLLPSLADNPGLMKGQLDKDSRAFQLDSIQDLVNNNGLTNVTVYSPEIGLDTFSNRYNNIKFVWKDLDTGFRINEICKKVKDETIKSKLKYKFINYNWRYENYRSAIAGYLVNRDSKLSWFHKISNETFKSSLWFDIENWDEETRNKLLTGVQELDKNAPIQFDTNVHRPSYLSGRVQDRLTLPNIPYQSDFIDADAFSDVFCAVVNESGFLDPTAYVSEKTIFPLVYETPFIISGPPGALKLLKDNGFKTFSDFWDESYDKETDHEIRLYKILKVIDYIDSLNYDDLASITEQMQDILIHNKNNLKRLVSR